MFKKSLIVAMITFALDYAFHFFLTHPMETLTYFVVKFLLAFFVASALFSFLVRRKKRMMFLSVGITGLIFSTVMSLYYRAWELGEAGVPFGSRAPNIMGIERADPLLFSGTWWLGHALFFCVSIFFAEKFIRK